MAAWEADSGTDAEIYFSRWSAGAWSPAQAVHTRPDAWDYSPSVAIATSPGSQAQVGWPGPLRPGPILAGESCYSRWAAGVWTEPQAGADRAVARVTAPALAASADGTLWLAWAASDGTDTEVYAARWNGQSWSAAVAGQR